MASCSRDGCGEPRASANYLCRLHFNAYMREWKRTEAGKRSKQRTRLARYGITLEDYEALWLAQGGKCANPGCDNAYPLWGTGDRNEILCVDHDHATGQVRGLLCSGCNKTLGYMQDDPGCLTGLISYLEGKVL